MKKARALVAYITIFSYDRELVSAGQMLYSRLGSVFGFPWNIGSPVAKTELARAVDEKNWVPGMLVSVNSLDGLDSRICDATRTLE